MTTHAHPNPTAMAPLRRRSLGSRYYENTDAGHGKWLLAALLVVLAAAVAIGFSL